MKSRDAKRKNVRPVEINILNEANLASKRGSARVRRTTTSSKKKQKNKKRLKSTKPIWNGMKEKELNIHKITKANRNFLLVSQEFNFFLRLSKQASTSNELIFSSMDVEKTCDGLQKKKTKMIFHGHGCRKKWSFVYPH